MELQSPKSQYTAKSIPSGGKKISYLERLFTYFLQAHGHDQLVTEHRFAAESVGGTGAGVRKRLNSAGLKDWRFDFADIDNLIAVEIEGGAFIGGRHNRGAGFRDDCDKYNNAAILGWTVLRFTDREVKTGQALETLNRLYAVRMKAGTLNKMPECSLTN